MKPAGAGAAGLLRRGPGWRKGQQPVSGTQLLPTLELATATRYLVSVGLKTLPLIAYSPRTTPPDPSAAPSDPCSSVAKLFSALIAGRLLTCF